MDCYQNWFGTQTQYGRSYDALKKTQKWFLGSGNMIFDWFWPNPRLRNLVQEGTSKTLAKVE